MLRAHPLRRDSIITGEVFGRQLIFATTEYEYPFHTRCGHGRRRRIHRRGACVAPSRATASPFHVDVGTGVRFKALRHGRSAAISAMEFATDGVRVSAGDDGVLGDAMTRRPGARAAGLVASPDRRFCRRLGPARPRAAAAGAGAGRQSAAMAEFRSAARLRRAAQEDRGRAATLPPEATSRTDRQRQQEFSKGIIAARARRRPGDIFAPGAADCLRQTRSNRCSARRRQGASGVDSGREPDRCRRPHQRPVPGLDSALHDAAAGARQRFRSYPRSSSTGSWAIGSSCSITTRTSSSTTSTAPAAVSDAMVPMLRSRRSRPALAPADRRGGRLRDRDAAPTADASRRQAPAPQAPPVAASESGGVAEVRRARRLRHGRARAVPAGRADGEAAPAVSVRAGDPGRRQHLRRRTRRGLSDASSRFRTSRCSTRA